MVADGVADLVETAEGQRLAGRTSGDDRDRAHDVASATRTSGASGWMCASLGLVDDRREDAVEVEADDDLVDGADEGVVPLTGLGGGELHAPQPTTTG